MELESTKMTADQIVAKLQLKPLLPEGGYFRQTYKSDRTIVVSKDALKQSVKRPEITAILYLVTKENFSALHRLTTTEVWSAIAGAPSELSLIWPDGRLEKFKLGTNFSEGEVPQVVVPPGVWQGLRMITHSTQEWSLMGTVCSPGFEFDDFELANGAELLRQYPNHEATINSLTRQ